MIYKDELIHYASFTMVQLGRVPSRRTEGAKRLQGNSFSVFSKGIRLVLFRWSIFLDPVKNDILIEPLYIDRLYIDFAQCSG
ncbi:hypothetical protein AHAS_Ahas02G0099400 [Arachis hypogaea]|uniref:Uncharacterized protein n=1 Tax=Arachis hypogaea TaxID=3818 RepID=A0A445EE53_ARAHY|nr:hypothetical protein Ahy_A02g008290 isoform A [Arachis hypogaea]RYR73791.1 hypothetical protein Ahy_A02g008290 isoform B [Arachis hypogaea]